MAMQFKVPSMECNSCVEAVTKAVKTVDGEATVEVNLETKDVVVESAASESSFRDAIVAQGHTVS